MNDRLTTSTAKEKMMTYRYCQDESKALAAITIAKAMGKQAYMIRYRAGTIEVRIW